MDIAETNVRYWVYGNEVCPDTGKEHLQGYIEFPKQKGMRAVKKALGDTSAHLEVRRGTSTEAADYCKKDGKWKEWGSISQWGGARRPKTADLAIQSVKDGLTDIEMIEDDPSTFKQNQRLIGTYRKLIKEREGQQFLKEEFLNLELNPFQRKIMSMLSAQTERQLLWVHDPDGNTGKTWLSKHLLALGGCFRATNGKTKDIAFAYEGEPTFVMDLSRSLEEYVNYDILEQVKNGLIFSGKYESKHKVFRTPKMLVLANFAPDKSKLSKDRWVILNHRSMHSAMGLPYKPMIDNGWDL